MIKVEAFGRSESVLFIRCLLQIKARIEIERSFRMGDILLNLEIIITVRKISEIWNGYLKLSDSE